MFSGMGGFEYGIEEAGNNKRREIERISGRSDIQHRGSVSNPISTRGKQQWGKCINIGYSEIEWIWTIDEKTGKTKREKNRAPDIYRYHYPEHRNFGDATTIDVSGLPDFDLLVAGFPCQSFSIAGKRKGFNDTRGTLFFEIARVLRDKRPRYFLLENVKGLLSHDEGKTFATILGVLSDIGYRDIQWQVLNSKDFGVPQNRERVFITGHLGARGGWQIFPLGESNSNTDKSGKQSEHRIRAVGFDANYYKGVDGKRTIIAISDSGLHREKQIRTDILPPLRSNTGAGHDNLIVQRPHGFNKGGTKELPCLRSSRMEQNDFLMIRDGRDNRSCLRSGRTPEIGIKGQSIRRFTPIECERLQGFPDGWTKYGRDENGKKITISDTQRYKCIGNAVTTNVITAIMIKLLEEW